MKSKTQGTPFPAIVESTMGLRSIGAVLAERWRRARGLPAQPVSPTVWFHNGQPA